MNINDYYSNNFITCELRGRTGNIMFEVAHAFAKSLEFNRQLIIPRIDYLKNNILRNFDMIDFNYPYENMELIDYPFHFVEKHSPPTNKPTIYRGYFQSEKYIKKYQNVIKSFYRPTEEFIQRVNDDFPFLKDSIVGVINVRRGDYLLQSTRHPVVSIEYINEAINHLPKCDHYFVLSDDYFFCNIYVHWTPPPTPPCRSCIIVGPV